MEQYNSLFDIPQADRPTALTVGKFEGIHLGHQALFHQLCARASERDLEPTAISFMNPPKDITGKPSCTDQMIYQLEDRAACMAQAGVKRQIFIPFNEETAGISPELFITRLVLEIMQARFFICGEDFRFGKGAAGDIELCRSLLRDTECIMEVQPHLFIDGAKVSSSEICRLIEAGEIDKVSALLGRRYSIEGDVVSGLGVGRTLGFPTFNIRYPRGVLVPEGIFAGCAVINGVRYPAAVNSGKRPTIVEGGANLVEIHLLAEAVPETVTHIQLFLHRKIRDEIKFNSRDALVKQIKIDCVQAATILKEYHG